MSRAAPSVSKAGYARIVAQSRAAITKRCKATLASAVDGDRIILNRPAALADMAAAGLTPDEVSAVLRGETDRAPTKAKKSRPAKAAAPTAPRAKSKKRNRPGPAPRPEPSVPPPPRVPAPKDSELEQLRELLRPLTERFGTATTFKDWLAAAKQIEEIQQKRLSNEEARGRLISRELVSAHVFGALGGMTRKLLRDTPKTLARRVLGLGQGATVEDAERLIREHISSQIGPVKDKVTRTLRDPDDGDVGEFEAS
jgi:hypothetical protein